MIRGALNMDSCNNERQLVEKLIAIRKERRLTQVELAAKLGVTQQTISKIETGDRHLSLRSLCAVSRALGCEVRIVKR